MAETLSYDNTPQTEVLSTEEQDSLEVGEKLVAEQEGLLAGKYNNPQELEKAYLELQSKLGQTETDQAGEEGEGEEKEMTHQEMIDAGYEMTGEGIWWPKDDNVTEETPDYNNPYVCAKIDELAGDNRN